jgi:hypothetical protein
MQKISFVFEILKRRKKSPKDCVRQIEIKVKNKKGYFLEGDSAIKYCFFYTRENGRF